MSSNICSICGQKFRRSFFETLRDVNVCPCCKIKRQTTIQESKWAEEGRIEARGEEREQREMEKGRITSGMRYFLTGETS